MEKRMKKKKEMKHLAYYSIPSKHPAQVLPFKMSRSPLRKVSLIKKYNRGLNSNAQGYIINLRD